MIESLKAFADPDSSKNTDLSYQCLDYPTKNTLSIRVKSSSHSVEVCIIKDSCENLSDVDVQSSSQLSPIHFSDPKTRKNPKLNSPHNIDIDPNSLVRLQRQASTDRKRKMHRDECIFINDHEPSFDQSSNEEILFGESVHELGNDAALKEYYDNEVHQYVPNANSVTKCVIPLPAPSLRPPRSPVSSVTKFIKTPPKPVRKVLTAYV
jgi:hypothetical protein